jgi:hypothetical protein
LWRVLLPETDTVNLMQIDPWEGFIQHEI